MFVFAHFFLFCSADAGMDPDQRRSSIILAGAYAKLMEEQEKRQYVAPHTFCKQFCVYEDYTTLRPHFDAP